MADVTATQLYNACHVLFGPEIDVSVDFLRYLQMPGLKAVYRRKALETHPDRANTLACERSELEEKFKEVSAAYRELSDYLQNAGKLRMIDDRFRKAPVWPHGNVQPRSDGRRTRQDSSAQGFYSRRYRGDLPKRELLFGQYVYYCGLITYRELIEAIIWQKTRRPSVGNIALRWRWLYEDEIREILSERQAGEKFGEYALRGGYLTPDRLRIILMRQRMLQPRIGEYFVGKKILPVSFVEAMAEQLRLHNRRYRSG